jgi:hypothetical protein
MKTKLDDNILVATATELNLKECNTEWTYNSSILYVPCILS